MIGGSLSSYALSGNSTGKVAVAATAIVEISAHADIIGNITLPAQSAGIELLAKGSAVNSTILGGGTAVVDISTKVGTVVGEVRMNASARLDILAAAKLDNPTYLQVNKVFYFKVYDDGTYLTTIKPAEVITDLQLKLAINSSGSEVKLTFKRPADDFGASYDLKLGNKMEIYVTDRQVPNGKRLFSGILVDHEADFMTEQVEITLHGFGDEMNDYIIESGESLANGQAVQNAELGFSVTATGADIEHKFTVNASYKLSRMRYRLRGNSIVTDGNPDQGGGQNVSYTGQTVYLRLYNTEADLRAGVNFQYVATVKIDSIAFKEYSFEFNTAIPVTSGQTLYAKLSVNANQQQGQPPSTLAGMATGNIDPNSLTYLGASGYPSSWTAQGNDIWFEAYSSTGSTQATYNSKDPAFILRSLIDDYRSRGGTLRYTSTSIDNTNTLVSYPFNNNTLLEGVNKVLELCPEGWYWYVDQAENVIHLHQKAAEADHTFVIGKHITQLKVKQSIMPIVNKIYFVGGGDPVFYKKYTAPQTENSYKRQKAIRLKDGRVTVTDTANIMADRSFQSVPGIYLTVGVGDNNIHTDKGYDLELVRPGQMIKLASTGDTRAARYDQARFDADVYDYDPQNVGTQIFQIIDFAYTAKELVMTISNIGYDVNKRTADIKRNLKDEQFSDTPAVPET